MNRLRRVLTATFATAFVLGAPAALARTVAPSLPDAEIFATSNTATITDPADPRLDARLDSFDVVVRSMIRSGGGVTRSSRLLDGVFYSSELKATTFERSRDFDVNSVTALQLRRIADRVRRRFHQQAVLTFDYPERPADRRDAVEIELPGIDARRFREGLLADRQAQERLVGGSRTLNGRLVLIADRADLALAKRFIAAIGGDFARATVRLGHREFVG